MFQLKWLTQISRQAFIWLSGAGVLLFLWKTLNSYLLKRVVKKSMQQADKDSTRLEKNSNDVEHDWAEQGKLTDKDKNSS